MYRPLINAFLSGFLFYFFAVADVLAQDRTQSAGDILQVALPVSAVGLTFGYKDSEGTLQFAKSAGVTTAVTYALKYALPDDRPNGGKHAFPSGHTSISFASAEFIRKRYGSEYGVPAYVVASFVGYSRVESHQHYTDEVFAGAAIGILSSYAVTTPYRNWTIQEEADGKYYGLRFSRTW